MGRSAVEALCIQNNLRYLLRTTAAPFAPTPITPSTNSIKQPNNYHPPSKQTAHQAISGIEVVSVVLLVLGNLFYLIMPYLGGMTPRPTEKTDPTPHFAENVGSFYQLAELWVAQPLVNHTFHADTLLALMALRLARKARQLNTTRNVVKFVRDRAIRSG